MFMQVAALASLLAIAQAGLLQREGVSTGYGAIGYKYGGYGGLGAGYGGFRARYGGLGSQYGGLSPQYGGLGAQHGGLGAGYGGLGAGYVSHRGTGITLGGIGYGRGYGAVDYYAPPNYQYKYGVQDPHTGDWKEKSESRVGGLTKTQYAWGEGDRQVQEARVFASN